MTRAGVHESGTPSRLAEVRRQLARVLDPELDESVLTLGFVTAIEIGADDGVTITWRLPTYWCAVNFAWLMAADMRRAITALPWVGRVDLRLLDHMAADDINRAMATGHSFNETFASAPDTNLATLRQVFLAKGFQRRQERLLRHLLARDLAPATLVGYTVDDLRALTLDDHGCEMRDVYLERYTTLAEQAGWPTSTTPAFVDPDGRPLDAQGLRVHLRRLALVSLNVEINGSVCRGLLAAREPAEQLLPAHARRE